MRRASLQPLRLKSKRRTAPQFHEVVRAVAEALPQSTGFVIALTVIAYYCGWREAEAYYGRLGAQWFVSGLPPIYFLLKSGKMMAAIVFSTYLSISHLSKPGRDDSNIELYAYIVALVSLLCTLVAFASDLSIELLSEEVQWKFASVGAVLMYFATGMLIGAITIELKRSGLKWHGKAVNLLYYAMFHGIYLAPSQLGAAQADYHLAPAANDLTIANIGEGKNVDSWRLVEVVGGNALLLKPAAQKGKQMLRIAEAKELVSIRVPSR